MVPNKIGKYIREEFSFVAARIGADKFDSRLFLLQVAVLQDPVHIVNIVDPMSHLMADYIRQLCVDGIGRHGVKAADICEPCLAHFVEEYISVDDDPTISVELLQDRIRDHVYIPKQVSQPGTVTGIQVKIHVLVYLRSLLHQLPGGRHVDRRGGIGPGDWGLWKCIGGVRGGVHVILAPNCLPIFSGGAQFCKGKDVPADGVQDVGLSNVGYNIIRLEQQGIEAVCGYRRGFFQLRYLGL